MKLTRSTTAPERGTDARPTHVLHWVPGYLNSAGCGSWELQAAADYEAGKPGGSDPGYDAPRDAPADSLALWVAGQLGSPAELELAYATLATAGVAPLNVHVGKEPVYYVTPAGDSRP
jgi:hypothetical protein